MKDTNLIRGIRNCEKHLRITAKNILQKANYARSDPNLALLAYRNTPTEGVGSSPAQRLFGRRKENKDAAANK